MTIVYTIVKLVFRYVRNSLSVKPQIWVLYFTILQKVARARRTQHSFSSSHFHQPPLHTKWALFLHKCGAKKNHEVNWPFHDAINYYCTLIWFLQIFHVYTGGVNVVEFLMCKCEAKEIRSILLWFSIIFWWVYSNKC